jgi:hypothetical protein
MMNLKFLAAVRCRRIVDKLKAEGHLSRGFLQIAEKKLFDLEAT